MPRRPPAGGGRAGTVVGEARGLQLRTEAPYGEATWQVWTFRIDRFDDAGNPLPAIPVEIRARSIEGAITEGDWVEVAGPWAPGQTLHVRDVLDLTTGAHVVAKRDSSAFGCMLLILVAAIFVAAAAFVAYQVLNPPHIPVLNPPSIPNLPGG